MRFFISVVSGLLALAVVRMFGGSSAEGMIAYLVGYWGALAELKEEAK